MKKIVCLVYLFFFLAACSPVSSVRDGSSGQGTPPRTAKSPGISAREQETRGVPESTPVQRPEEPVSMPLPDEQDDMDDAISGVVIEVIDGDKLIFQPPDGVLLRVKLAGIDAPGLRQPYGLRARDYLVRICAKKEAWIVIETTGVNKQVVGSVRCQAVPGKEPVDAAAEQLRRGVAWVEKENPDDAGLKALEAEARSRRRGLWTDPNPVAPWDWDEK